MVSKKVVRWLSVFTIALAAAATPKVSFAEAAPVCGAGGVGSTGCSVAAGTLECSVTCAQGYYSCCNMSGVSGGVSGCKCQPINAQ